MGVKKVQTLCSRTTIRKRWSPEAVKNTNIDNYYTNANKHHQLQIIDYGVYCLEHGITPEMIEFTGKFVMDLVDKNYGLDATDLIRFAKYKKADDE